MKFGPNSLTYWLFDVPEYMKYALISTAFIQIMFTFVFFIIQCSVGIELKLKVPAKLLLN